MSFGPLFIQPTNSLAIWLGGKSLQEIQEITFEIGMLGQYGVLRALPGRVFSAPQLVCIMYAGFKRIEPGMDIGGAGLKGPTGGADARANPVELDGRDALGKRSGVAGAGCQLGGCLEAWQGSRPGPGHGTPARQGAGGPVGGCTCGRAGSPRDPGRLQEHGSAGLPVPLALP